MKGLVTPWWKIGSVCVLTLFGCPKRMPTEAQTIVFIAKAIRTMDPARPTAEALAMRGGKILAVGTRQDVLQAAGPGAAVETFASSTIVPGLVDAHAHLASLGRSLSIVALSTAASEADAVARMKAAGPSSTQGEWLLGRGWDQNDWPGGAFPTKASLDAVFPTRPVFMTRVDGHAVWVNSKAMEIAGIGRTTVDPPGGRLLRDKTGAPTGVLVDNAIDLVSVKIPPPSPDELRRRLRSALEACARLGLTQIHDAGTEMAVFRVLQEWDRAGLLPVRVYAMADGQEGAVAQAFLDEGPFLGSRLELRAVKFLMDGALGSRGAALKEPYSDEPAQRGLLLLELHELERRARAFAERGFQVAVHAIGDRANSLTIEALSALERDHPGGRHRVEHAQVLSPDDIPRFASGGLIASFQPTHATSDMPWAEARLGPQRVAGAYAWRAVLDAGAHVAFGSDFPVEDPNPLWGLYAARTRQDHSGNPPGGWRPEQKVTALEALAGFTTGAAYAAFAEQHRGVLKEGYDADFIVLPVDPAGDSPHALLRAQVQVTVVDGVDVFRSLPSPPMSQE